MGDNFESVWANLVREDAAGSFVARRSTLAPEAAPRVSPELEGLIARNLRELRRRNDELEVASLRYAGAIAEQAEREHHREAVELASARVEIALAALGALQHRMRSNPPALPASSAGRGWNRARLSA